MSAPKMLTAGKQQPYTHENHCSGRAVREVAHSSQSATTRDAHWFDLQQAKNNHGALEGIDSGTRDLFQVSRFQQLRNGRKIWLMSCQPRSRSCVPRTHDRKNGSPAISKFSCEVAGPKYARRAYCFTVCEWDHTFQRNTTTDNSTTFFLSVYQSKIIMREISRA